MTRLRADAILLVVAAIWGIAFLFQKSAMSHLGPLAFIAARSALAVLALLPLALREQGTPAATKKVGFWIIAALAGADFFVASWLQQTGLKTATVTNTGFLTALYVVVTPFMAWAWNRKAPRPVVWPAAMLAMIGIWLLGGGTVGALSHGDALVAVSAVFWGALVVISGHAARYDQPISFTAAQFATVSVLATVGAALLESPTRAGFSAAAVDIAYMGLLSSAIGYSLMTAALRHTPPSDAAVIFGSETVFAAGVGYLVLGERLSANGWLGATLILLAIVVLHFGNARHTRVRLSQSGELHDPRERR